MKFFTKISLLLLITVSIFYSCNKSSEITEIQNTSPTDTSFDTSSLDDNEKYQEEDIVSFIIEGISIIDGRLAFDDHDALINARHELSKYNEESLIAWTQDLGLVTLFSELVRLENLENEITRAEINATKNYDYFFQIDKDGVVETTCHSPIDAIIYNTEGIIQVGDYIGIIGSGINIWTSPDNKKELIEVISKREIQNEKNFIILDDRVFKSDEKDWFRNHTNCPRDEGTDWGWTDFLKNPDANRRIKVRNQFIATTTPRSNGNVDYDCEYWIFSHSFKGTGNRYKTDHYLSINVDVTPFFGIPLGWSSNRQNTSTVQRTKRASIVNHIKRDRNVSRTSLLAGGIRLIRTNPGADGSLQEGSAASHRGMDGLYVRQNCN